MDDGSESPVRHPLDRLTGRGWLLGAARLALAAGIVAVVILLTGRESWSALLRAEHLPMLLAGAALTLGQRVLRVRKWALILEGLPLVPRSWRYLLRIQLVGLLANLVVPVSEALKVWAVSAKRRDAPLAVETILMDTAQEALMVGVAALGAASLLAGDGPWWLWLPGAGLAAAGASAVLGIRFRPRREPGRTVRVRAPMLAVSALETACLLGSYAAALHAVGAPVRPLFLAAVFPLLYASHLVSITPGGLGVREALFALVFGGLSRAPGEVAVAMGLMISAMQLLVALAAGTAAVAWPGRRAESVL